MSYFLVASDTQVLLVDHKNAQLWLPTGGHVEPGEHPRDTGDGDLPIYGHGGWVAGAVRTGAAGWHDLHLVPGMTPAQITGKLGDVEARP